MVFEFTHVVCPCGCSLWRYENREVQRCMKLIFPSFCLL